VAEVGEGSAPQCPLCVGSEVHGPATRATACGHAFCPVHMDSVLAAGTCAVCAHPVDAACIRAFTPLPEGEPKRFGAKIAAVLQKLRELLDAGERKILVYVQFPDLQKALVKALEFANVEHLVLKGSPAIITSNLRTFADPHSTANVLVLSLAKKAAGMNLTCSSHVLFLHPFLDRDQERAAAWEAQAIGRVARPGQTKQVQVWRFITRNTVESELVAHGHMSSWQKYFSAFSGQPADTVKPEVASQMASQM
jgi:SNF2 family DNA or RNA helicase